MNDKIYNGFGQNIYFDTPKTYNIKDIHPLELLPLDTPSNRELRSLIAALYLKHGRYTILTGRGTIYTTVDNRLIAVCNYDGRKKAVRELKQLLISLDNEKRFSL